MDASDYEPDHVRPGRENIDIFPQSIAATIRTSASSERRGGAIDRAASQRMVKNKQEGHS